MSHVLHHPKGVVRIDELPDGKRRITIEDANPSVVVTRKTWDTAYSVPLIESILQAKGPGALCDEIMRDEAPDYVISYLRYAMLGYLPPAAFEGSAYLILAVVAAPQR